MARSQAEAAPAEDAEAGVWCNAPQAERKPREDCFLSYYPKPHRLNANHILLSKPIRLSRA